MSVIPDVTARTCQKGSVRAIHEQPRNQAQRSQFGDQHGGEHHEAEQGGGF